MEPRPGARAVRHLVAPQSHFPLRVRPTARMTDEALHELCRINRDLRIERTADGELIVMSPTGGETGRRNAALIFAVSAWAARDRMGVVFDSSTGFVLPNGAERAPDVAWVKSERWRGLTPEQRERFPPLCPDFVIELRSASDAIDELHAKMREYAANGALLGWLIDPESRCVWVYDGRREAVCLEQPVTIAGDPVLQGFVLELGEVW
jgi:Uma2 family endonuclease